MIKYDALLPASLYVLSVTWSKHLIYARNIVPII